VVLLAGVCGADGYLRTNEQVEWTISPVGVGQFVDVHKGSWANLFLCDFTRPGKLSSTFAVGSTSRSYLRLNRGTPAAADDVCVLPGQTWVSVASAVEGTTYVTAFAPSVPAWDSHKEVATIHWVDVEWQFPPPAINPAGTRHVFTTAVMRHTDQAPCVGWRVRYEILDGPAAAFAPDGSQIAEVATNEAGQASVEIFQTQPASGTNRIGIQVIRPAALDGSGGQRLVVGSGSTTKTWSSPEVSLQKTGPATAGVGDTITYRIVVSNPGNLPLEGVRVTDEVPQGLEYLGSNPVAQATGRRLQWQLGQLGANQSRALEVSLRTGRQGGVTSCADATAAGGLTARDCVTTTVGAATVDLKVSGPHKARVGDQVTFELTITNRGQQSATGLVIKDWFDEGFQHAVAQSPITRSLGTLAPNQSRRIGVTFRAARAGRLCHDVEVTGAGGIRVTGRGCVTVSRTTPEQPAPLQPEPTGQAAVSVEKSGPSISEVDKRAEFVVIVTNTGQQTLTNVKVVDHYDASLAPDMATEGYQFDADSRELSWTIDTLSPGRSTRLRVECRCKEVALQACNRVTVATEQGPRAEDQACLRISPAAAVLPSMSGLAMSVVDLRDPVSVGKEFTYEIRVTNNAQTSDRQVTLLVTVPDQMLVVRLGTSGPSKYDVDGQTIRFEPVAEIRSGETITYRVRVLAQQPGEVQLRAQLTSQNVQQAITVEESTQVFAQNP